MKYIIDYCDDGFIKNKELELDDRDVWSFDVTLAPIIHAGLVKLRDIKHGSPMVDDDDVPLCLRANDIDPVEGVDYNFHARWDWVLNEMIWAFNQLVIEDWEDQYFGTKIDLDGHKAHGSRMRNGFELFGKYYTDLWD